MDSKKPRKRDRIPFLKRKEPTQPAAIQAGDSLACRPLPSDAKTGDRERTRVKYFDSAKQLENAIKSNKDKWGSFDFPELKGEPEDFDDSLFRDKMYGIIDARKKDVDQAVWAKCMHAVQCAFTAFSPFAKNFLSIAKDVQAVCSPLSPSLIHRSQY